MSNIGSKNSTHRSSRTNTCLIQDDFYISAHFGANFALQFHVLDEAKLNETQTSKMRRREVK